jgi:thiamine pyrophosphate-dependent acetolactate synthase large subunit-like protein
MSDHRNGGAAIVETLAAHGVDTIFGIPGTHNLELYRHFEGNGVRAVTPRHEQGAGYAAEAYARVSGRPGVVVTTSGPGLTNAMTAAATAYAESQPVLLLSSGMPTGAEGHDLGQLHEAKNASGAMGQLVAWSRRVGSPDEAAAAVTEAFVGFTGRRPRPAHIEIPVDVLEQAWTGEPRIGAATAPPVADPDAVRRAADLLARAERPMIIAGGGAVDAQTELTALAEALGAPVATTVNGKGAVDESHPLSVGASIRLRAVQKAAADSDGLLVLGTELGDSDLWEGQIRGQEVIRCDIDAAQLDKNCPADHRLLGDSAATLAALLDALPARPAGGQQRANALRSACRDEAAADAGPYAEINAAVRAALPADAVLAGDSSQVTYFGSVHYFDVPAPRRFCYSPGYATLGYGLPAGLGAALGRPGAPAAVLLGDGAFMFSVQELMTLVEQRLSVPVIVVDSGGYREISDQEAARGIPPIGVELRTPDFAALAVAMGANGVRSTSAADLSELVATALSADGPTLIHFDIR